MLQVMLRIVPELLKLSPQATVHAKAIYSAVNVLRRTSPDMAERMAREIAAMPIELVPVETDLQLVRQAALEMAILMVLHDLSLAGLYADRVALLANGRIFAQGSPALVLTEENLSAIYQVPVHVIPHPEHGAPLVLPLRSPPPVL